MSEEVIAGKCSVVCTSEDLRNPQVSREALENAHFIFYCTFDVGELIVFDKLPDEIAGIDVKHLLNRKKDQATKSSVKDGANGHDRKGKAHAGGTGDLVAYHDEKVNVAKQKAQTVLSKDKPLNKLTLGNSIRKSIDDLQRSKNVAGAKMVFQTSDDVDSDTCSTQFHKENSEKSKLCKKKINSSDESLQKFPPVNLVKRCTEVGHQIVEVTQRTDAMPSKKLTLGSKFRKSPVDLQRSKNVGQTSDEVDCDRCSTQLQKENSEKIKLSEKKIETSDESLQKVPPVVSLKEDVETEHQIIETTRRLHVDRSKWFKELPWEVRLNKANEQGTLVFLENFDRSLTSTDIQDILSDTFNQNCAAKVIPYLPPYHSPHYGQAYAIFKTADAADDAIRRINMGCLIQPNGSVFIASKGMLPQSRKETKHPGHFTIRTKPMQRGEMKKAVYTSHCSQDGTIEYDLSMDWILLQEIAVESFIRLHKGHGDVLKEVRKNLKTRIPSEKTQLNGHFQVWQ